MNNRRTVEKNKTLLSVTLRNVTPRKIKLSMWCALHISAYIPWAKKNTSYLCLSQFWLTDFLWTSWLSIFLFGGNTFSLFKLKGKYKLVFFFPEGYKRRKTAVKKKLF